MILRAPTSRQKLTYDQAFLYALTLSYNKHKDWRLPTSYECSKEHAIPIGTWSSDFHIQQADVYPERYAIPVRYYDN